jgi:hypothetical protein
MNSSPPEQNRTGFSATTGAVFDMQADCLYRMPGLAKYQWFSRWSELTPEEALEVKRLAAVVRFMGLWDTASTK